MQVEQQTTTAQEVIRLLGRSKISKNLPRKAAKTRFHGFRGF
jgi:hypothetical protein